MSEINPYQSPKEPAIVSERSPSLNRVARNIRAICILYIVLGSLFALGAFAMLIVDNAGVPGPFESLVLVLALCGVVSAVGVLRRSRWGIPFCQLVSALYLLNFPIGTILGAYFLINIGKVKDAFR